MADWSHPGLGDPYSDVLTTHITGRDVDAITLQKSTPSNLPNGAIAYDRSADLFKEWDLGSLVFVNKKLSVAGGGTGADNATQARTNLGLGTIAAQDASAVAITGGSISGITLDASTITSGIIALARGGLGASLVLGSSGKVLQSNGAAVVFGTDGSALINLNGSNISSGTISQARLPSGIGKITQVIFTTTSSNHSIVTGGYAAVTGHTIIITPTVNTSTVQVKFSFNVRVGVNSGFAADVSFRIKRNGSVVFTKSSALYLNPSGTTTLGTQIDLDYIDSPATISACTYQLEVAMTLGSGFGIINFNNEVDPMFATEILA